MSIAIKPPFPLFTDRNGDPLENGYIFVGVENMNPEVFPIQVYWDEELTIPASQPIRTTNGYPSRSGTPSWFFTGGDDYSLTVKDKNLLLVFSSISSPVNDGNLRDELASSVGTDLIGYGDGTLTEELNSINVRLGHLKPIHEFGYVSGDAAIAMQASIDAVGYAYLPSSGSPYSIGVFHPTIKANVITDGQCELVMLPGDGQSPMIWLGGLGSYFDSRFNIDCGLNSRTAVRIDASQVTAFVKVKNQRAVVGSANTTCGLHLATGTRFRGYIHYVDAANAGHPNESVPRAASIDSVFGKYQLDYMHLENNDSGGLVTVGGDGVIGQIIGRSITDQCIYSVPALSGSGAVVRIGEINIDAGEEVVVAGGKSLIDIGRINISTGSGYVLGVQDLTGSLNVGAISFLSTSVGGVIEAPAVSGIIRTRSGNTSSPGKVSIGGVYGAAKLGATFGIITGTLGQLSIGQSDVLFSYDAAFANATSQFMNLSGCQSYSIRNFKMTIYDKADVLTAASIFTVSLPVSPLATSDWHDVEYYVNTSANAVSAASVRIAGLNHANVQAKGVRWQHNVGPYGREATIGPKDSITGVPTIGYWPVNTDLILTGKTAAPFRARVTASGTPGTWVSY